MGPVPTGFTLEKLIGKQLNQVCIGPFDLKLSFDCTHGIGCTGTVIVEMDNRSFKVFQGEEPYWLDVTPLPLIAGREVTAWKIESSHEFSVSLTGGVRLRFLSTDCAYEDFVITPELWVV